jgi:alkylated DNA repair dioxygenase AlkB
MERIALEDGAYLELDAHWLPDADATLAALMREVPFEARAIKLFGREVMQPRLVAWIGDPEAVYTYSGVRHQPLPWTPTLAALRARLALPFNSVLCNLYRDGRDSMGLHSDSEPELGPDPVVASISLGAPRRFQLRHRHGAHKLTLTLPHGSLLLMRGPTQRFYRHAVPKEPALTTPRVNLTFRRIV